nr:oligopeptide ABC transporter substrate-binding protein [Lactobacillus amylovorus]
MKKAKVFAGITLLSGVALTLAACGKPSNQNANEASTAAKFSSVVPTKAAKNGGTVKVAVETDTPFTGIFNDELSTSATDTEVMQYGAESLFSTDD